MLLNEDRVAVGIDQDEARGPHGRLVGPGRQLKASVRERSLDVAHVVVIGNVAPARSQPGLNVRMFESNMPWNSPIVLVSF